MLFQKGLVSLSILSFCFVLPTRFCVPECHRNRVECSTTEKVFLFSVSPFATEEKTTRRHSEIKRIRSTTKQEFSGEAFSKLNIKASLASLPFDSSRPTEWSAIFAFGVWSTAKLQKLTGSSWKNVSMSNLCILLRRAQSMKAILDMLDINRYN